MNINDSFELFADVPKNYTGVARIIVHKLISFVENGNKHRTDGPAIVYDNGESLYYYHSILLQKEQWFECLNEEEKIKALFNIDEWK